MNFRLMTKEEYIASLPDDLKSLGDELWEKVMEQRKSSSRVERRKLRRQTHDGTVTWEEEVEEGGDEDGV